MDAVMLAVIGAVLLLLGGAAVVFGVLPLDAALEIGDRVWPILLFVVAVTIVAELAARAGPCSTPPQRAWRDCREVG